MPEINQTKVKKIRNYFNAIFYILTAVLVVMALYWIRNEVALLDSGYKLYYELVILFVGILVFVFVLANLSLKFYLKEQIRPTEKEKLTWYDHVLGAIADIILSLLFL